ncbi:hypothetical protein [EBPR siphovirus 1]|jgi:hypothetical protein|nr:hypothetical protein [EBPR siphovirus 1]
MNPRPFTKSYVLGVTIDNQLAAVEKSLVKTLARSIEPGISDETSVEIFLTIQALYDKRRQLVLEKSQIKS